MRIIISDEMETKIFVVDWILRSVPTMFFLVRWKKYFWWGSELSFLERLVLFFLFWWGGGYLRGRIKALTSDG